MLYFINCKVDIATQDETYPTYIKIDCDLHTNANDDGFYGRLIDCDLYIITTLATACTSWNQGIRLSVTINDVDVTSALIGNVNVTHNKNMASTFSLSLGDVQYSPHTNSNIGLSKEVVITAYINGHEKKLITGFVDDINMNYSPNVSININGMDYSKKLLDKRDTLISVQNETTNSLRNEIIEYIAEQAELSDMDIPLMDTVSIDNSFSDQALWDMIQKEAIINLYWVRFNEDGTLQLRLDEVKTNTTTYPTADWTYGENRIIALGLKKSDSDIINKIIVLGAISETKIPTTIEGASVNLLIWNKTWGIGAPGDHSDIVGTFTSGDFEIKIRYTDSFYPEYRYDVTIRSVGTDFTVTSINYAGDNITMIYTHSDGDAGFYRHYGAGSLSMVIEGKERDITEWDVRYDQISASITDPSSITKYKERDGGSIELPLIETQDQCEEIGKKIIRDSHRGLTEPRFEVPFNPLLETGQTIEITDKKIGFSAERWHVERVSHNIDMSGDGIKGRTGVGCVYYAST